MTIEFEADNVEIKPGYYKSMSCVAEVSPDSVLKEFDIPTVVDHFKGDAHELLSEIDKQQGVSFIANHYGSELISEFHLDEILEVYTIEDIIKHIGEEHFKNYIRDIYIDKILK